jgi:methyl-accepting chemotaxis protein
MGEINAASREQSIGIEQVCQTVTVMDESTQQNAALVEEMSAASRALEEQASMLVQAVARFIVDGDSGAMSRPDAEPPRLPAGSRTETRPRLAVVPSSGPRPIPR